MKKNIVVALLLFLLAAVILSIDSKYYIYFYYRFLNGSDFTVSDRKLAPGFFFYKKEQSGEFTIFHRDISDIPLYVDINRRNEFSGFLIKGLIDVRLKNNDCIVYEDKTNPKNIYIEYDEKINAILGVDKASGKDLLVLCGMLLPKK